MWFFSKHLSSLLLLISLPVALAVSSRVSADISRSTFSSVLNPPDQMLLTQTRFREEETVSSEAIPYQTTYIEDSELEFGQETLVQEGRNGEKQVLTTMLYYDDAPYSSHDQETIIREAQDKVIAQGTKVVHRTLQTESGQLTYWKHIPEVWATSYDSTCPGCSSTTATGMRQGYGVVAVDPNLIPLHSRLYILGYGIGVAGDVGGSIRGKRIDLGFDSLTGQWASHFVDVYLLTD